MKVYISGKIGEEVISDATRRKFARAEETLRAKGYVVFNPADERWQRTLEREYGNDQYVKSPLLMGKFPDFYSYALLRDQMKLSVMDAVYFLEDWRLSPGATAEYYFAKAVGKRMLFAQHFHAICRLEENYRKLVAKGKPPVQREDGEDDIDVRNKYVRKHIDEVWIPIGGKEEDV
jgi:hypothetical protein